MQHSLVSCTIFLLNRRFLLNLNDSMFRILLFFAHSVPTHSFITSRLHDLNLNFAELVRPPRFPTDLLRPLVAVAQQDEVARRREVDVASHAEQPAEQAPARPGLGLVDEDAWHAPAGLGHQGVEGGHHEGGAKDQQQVARGKVSADSTPKSVLK